MTAMPISSFFMHPSASKTCLWFLPKNKNADAKRSFYDRRRLISVGIAKA